MEKKRVSRFPACGMVPCIAYTYTSAGNFVIETARALLSGTESHGRILASISTPRTDMRWTKVSENAISNPFVIRFPNGRSTRSHGLFASVALLAPEASSWMALSRTPTFRCGSSTSRHLGLRSSGKSSRTEGALRFR
ncbi:hypothetical protein GJ744_008817 [Endocarpon pusillum]|uniref:Uncharacterized protein n=1 Tax=Endocarpon pusillum TaxID=364733 RepID=A0A8H7E9S6_9EURO|nr:hypothetical protein GJ744_008817 [Endocarpon pusillum]